MRRWLSCLALIAVLTAPAAGQAKIAFIQNASETTVTSVLYPWTQASACSCCVCWETALATIFAYWDDHAYQGAGPWERLLYGGNGKDAFRFKITTDELYKASGLACSSGSYPATLFSSSQSKQAGVAYANTKIGYTFDFDDDQLVWFGTDLADEIDAGKPVYYGYCPEGTGCHAVTMVGYDDSDETLFIYKNWHPVVTRKGFDDCTDARDIDITPGGRSPKPANWTCAASQWEGGDGCHCKCGTAYDPDCDGAGKTIGCPNASDTCGYDGQCHASCQDDCPQTGATSCQSGKVATCGDANGDGCLEWGAGIACTGADVCQNGACVPSCSDECATYGDSSCASQTSVSECGQFDSDSCLDLRTVACASGKACKAGQCVTVGCTDACPAGATRCVDAAHAQKCVDQNGDGCLEWGPTLACPAATRCEQNACRSNTQPGVDGGVKRDGWATAEHCQNNIDDDGDGLVDCEDSDCQGLAACAVPEICDNGRDDDGDSAIDCADHDCANAPHCQNTGSSGGCALGGVGGAGPGLAFALLLLGALLGWRRLRSSRPPGLR